MASGDLVILQEILDAKAREVASFAPSSIASARAIPPRPVCVAEVLRRGAGQPLRLVAEYKRRSPSAGPLSSATPAEQARRYVVGGASMISVLTDHAFFGGSFADLADVRSVVEVPLLAKEFVIDERQIARARIHGADAVLLIVRICTKDRLLALADAARDLGLEPVVEVVTEVELEVALDAKATIIGVNARDLDTLEMDASRAARVLARIPPGVVAVHLSGLKTPDDVARIAASRVDAALIGEAMMRAADPSAELRTMRARC